MDLGFSLQLKPVGSECNLVCSYCYAQPFKTDQLEVMSDQVLERAIAGCIAGSAEPTITWHGGEPLVAGLKFYQRAQKIIAQHQKPGQIVRQVMQTNATLITNEFASFLKEVGFEVGVSIDGPEHVHNLNRVDYAGRGSFRKTMRGLEQLRKAGLDPSVIATVTTETLPFATEVFDFLVEVGFRSIKYSPVFDSQTDRFSISSERWFEYLAVVFGEWYGYGDPDISILDLDEVIAWLDRKPYPMCSSNRSCLSWVSIDPDGTMYPCAYFRAEMPYGNIMTTPLREVAETVVYQKFRQFHKNLPEECKACEFFDVCGNGCPATRVRDSVLDPMGVYVYCEERRMLFAKIKSVFEQEQ